MEKAISLDKPMLRVSVAPHIQQKITTSHLMYNTLIALVPALLAGIYFFGFASLKLALICMATAVACEAGMKGVMGRKLTIINGSSLVLGLLFALICSPEAPLVDCGSWYRHGRDPGQRDLWRSGQQPF